ncbi:MAG: aminotransferase class I/II-fold pyridoxal phosphate-dependent enzyme [Candidatus Korobacteraceae bacterium]
MPSRTQSRSPYMEFSKLRTGAKYNLAASGIMSYPLAELPVRIDELEINGTDAYGYAPLNERLARLNGVPQECVVAAAGTSMANHLAMAATVEPGDEVLVEHPTYQLLVSVAQYLGATVRYFERRMEDGFRIDPEEVERQITPRTKLIVITNLHNPSGAIVDENTLRALGDIAKKANALVLVDEVYLEALFERRPRPALHLGEQFLVTSSLTKAYGLSGLRCGWVLAAPELAQRMWRINDLYGVNAAHPAELLSVIALDNLDRIATRAKELIATNRRVLDAFLASRCDLEYHRPEFGTLIFLKPRFGRVDELCRLLEKYETCVAPGSYFDVPEGFRVGIGGDPEMTREGLSRLGLALDGLGKSS